MSQFTVRDVDAFCRRVVPGLRQTQARNLCWVVFGLLAAGQPSRSAVARWMVGPQRLIHRIKRVWRFINNPRLPQGQVMAQLVYFNWLRAAGQKRPRVVMDWTDLGNDTVSLWTALVFRGRTVPLLCEVQPKSVAEGSRNTAEHQMILALKALVGTGWVLVADRGFARATLFEMLHKERIDFVIRFDDDTTVWVNGKPRRTGDIPLSGKSQRWLGSVQYHAKAKVPLQVLLCESDDSRWNLATSLDSKAKATVRQIYYSRMQIEEMFRDLPQHLHIEKMPCTTLARKATWLLLCALAYSYLYWLGVLAQARGLSERYHYWKTESVFWLGLQLVRHHDSWLTTLTKHLLRPKPIPLR
jgi:hypothetical protein